MNGAIPSVLLLAPAVLLGGRAPVRAQGSVHLLEPTPATVAYGYYWAKAHPVLRVRSGDMVRVHTLITSTPKRLEAAGVKAADVEPALRDVVEHVTDKGPGGHILNGPIYVEGARPGDVLEVQIRQIDLAIPYAYNGFRPGAGFLPEDFGDESRTRIIPLDRKRMLARFAPGISVPLHPFFGSVGVAPPDSLGRVSSAPPSSYAGNLDNKELVAGTTLYIPVFVAGALLEVGDGHAGQGNGEVDITALETSLVGTFRLVVRKDMHLTWPRAETPTHWITMGMDKDLVTATKTAVRQAIDFLSTQKGLSREDAYQLVSIAGDVDITQLVDGNVGVHVLIPKAIFTRRRPASEGTRSHASPAPTPASIGARSHASLAPTPASIGARSHASPAPTPATVGTRSHVSRENAKERNQPTPPSRGTPARRGLSVVVYTDREPDSAGEQRYAGTSRLSLFRVFA